VSCRYTDAMRSVADDLRAETRHQAAGLDPLARVQLALELGDADAISLANARGMTVAEARSLCAASRGIGRVASVANRATS